MATIRKGGGTSLSTFVLEKKWDQQQPSIKIRLQVQEFRSLFNSVAREVWPFLLHVSAACEGSAKGSNAGATKNKVTCTYSGQGAMNAGSPCGEGDRVHTSNTDFHHFFSFFPFFSPHKWTDLYFAMTKMPVFRTHARWPIYQGNKKGPTKAPPSGHLAACHWSSAGKPITASRECSGLFSNFWHTWQIYSKFHSNAIRSKAKSNIVLFASIFKSFKYSRSPTNLSHEWA